MCQAIIGVLSFLALALGFLLKLIQNLDLCCSSGLVFMGAMFHKDFSCKANLLIFDHFSYDSHDWIHL